MRMGLQVGMGIVDWESVIQWMRRIRDLNHRLLVPYSSSILFRMLVNSHKVTLVCLGILWMSSHPIYLGSVGLVVWGMDQQLDNPSNQLLMMIHSKWSLNTLRTHYSQTIPPYSLTQVVLRRREGRSNSRTVRNLNMDL